MIFPFSLCRVLTRAFLPVFILSFLFTLYSSFSLRNDLTKEIHILLDLKCFRFQLWSSSRLLSLSHFCDSVIPCAFVHLISRYAICDGSHLTLSLLHIATSITCEFLSHKHRRLRYAICGPGPCHLHVILIYLRFVWSGPCQLPCHLPCHCLHHCHVNATSSYRTSHFLWLLSLCDISPAPIAICDRITSQLCIATSRYAMNFASPMCDIALCRHVSLRIATSHHIALASDLWSDFRRCDHHRWSVQIYGPRCCWHFRLILKR